MNDFLFLFIFIIILCVVLVLIYVIKFLRKLIKGDPTIWERSIRKFEKHDQKNGIKRDFILFTGSSSIVYWKTLTEDMAPLNVLNRGFGGSQIPDVTHYVDRIVLPYKPKGIVFYAGENDIAGLFISKKKTAEEVRDSFKLFCDKISSSYSEVPIYFISIKPPKRRKKFWDEIQKANDLIEDYCTTFNNLHYIDIVESMLDKDGYVQTDLFKWDGVHMNSKGYEIWTSIVKPILLQGFH
ncbi:MAG: GDSL-type esterase/lipase family protein [Candidatus Hodarchaeales archaeon]